MAVFQPLSAASRRRLRRFFSNRTSKQNRSKAGNILMFLFIAGFGAFSLIPLIMSVGMSFKPLNELYMFPPRLLPLAPTWDSYRMLFNLMSSTWIPLSRYFFNTIFITVVSTVGHILLSSMAAYPLAKIRFDGNKLINTTVMFSLMFVAAVNDVANYLIISALGWSNTYLAIIVPLMGAPLGLFIIRNYITAAIPDSLLEAARLDGSSEIGCYTRVVMPIIRPAWLTVAILDFQSIWGAAHTTYIYDEELKTFPYALSQITSGSMIKAGAAQAGSVLMLLVPAVVFILSQTQIIGAMATSGIKE